MKKRLCFLLSVIIIAISFSSCKGAKDVNTIDIILDWTPNTNHTGLYVADELGYFEEEGIKVNIVQPPEDSATMLVGAGKAEFCYGFQDSLAIALSSDTPVSVTAVAAVLQHNTSGIISRKSNKVLSPKDLEGKKLATWNSKIEHQMLKDIVEDDNGDFSKVEIIPTTITDIAAAFNMGIDAMNVYYGWDGIAAQNAGIDINFMPYSDCKKELDFYAPVILGNNEYIKNNPDKSKAFLKALKKGYDFAEQNPIEASDILVKRVNTINKDFAIKSQEWVSKRYKDDSSQWGIIDRERWNAFYEWLLDRGIINKDISNSGFSNEYLDLTN